jgi:hypothetical protein
LIENATLRTNKKTTPVTPFKSSIAPLKQSLESELNFKNKAALTTQEANSLIKEKSRSSKAT